MDDIEREPPARMTRATLYLAAALLLILLSWSALARLDIIASAQGRLVPQSFVKIVQPADGGIVQDILVSEGQRVRPGQILMRMDGQPVRADAAALRAELDNRQLQLRRIDAELAGAPLLARQDEAQQALFEQIQAQHRAHRQNYLDNLSQEQEVLRKSTHELDAARATQTKLRQSVPLLKEQAQGYASLGSKGFFPALQVQEKQREYMEREQDLRAQDATVHSLEAALAQSRQRLLQITSSYQRGLQNERVETQAQLHKLQQEWIKLQHKAEFLELKAPQGGLVKDLATHTPGTVVTPGAILLTLVPENEPLLAQVEIRNDDVGFVHPGQKVKVKLVAYPFQKYGMLDGVVTHLGADAQEPQPIARNSGKEMEAAPQTCKALVTLNTQSLQAGGEQLCLTPGMQVIAEIRQGNRTVLEYLLSPLRQALHDSGRER